MRRSKSSNSSPSSRYPFIEPSDDASSVYLRVRVQPRASKNEIAGEHNGALKIKLTAPPVEGEANASLVEFLSKSLKVGKRNIAVVSGLKSRDKLVRIEGLSGAALESLLDASLGSPGN